jgi:hypothetical protein
MRQPEHRPQITIEDLLRLKRAERPSPEFWSRFEKELHQKQLAALVQRRSWWQNLPQLLSRRAYLPVGATAVLAFTLISVRYTTSGTTARLEDPIETTAPAARHVPLATVATPVAVAAVPAREVQAPSIDDRTAVAANTTLSEQLPEHAIHLAPWSAPMQPDTPSARTIAATIATLEQTQPELANVVMGGRVPSGNHVEEAVSRTAELATVAAVASKRGRLLAQFNDRHFTPEPQAPEVLRERLARRMASEEINERFSRVDLQADRVLVKF